MGFENYLGNSFYYYIFFHYIIIFFYNFVFLNCTSGSRDAFTYGDACMQGSSVETEAEAEDSSFDEQAAGMSEDCLFLNIWVPHPRKDRMPVMVRGLTFIIWRVEETERSNFEPFEMNSLGKQNIHFKGFP